MELVAITFSGNYKYPAIKNKKKPFTQASRAPMLLFKHGMELV